MIIIGISVQEYSIKSPFLNSYCARGYCAFFSGLILGKYLQDKTAYKSPLWVRIFAVSTLMAGILSSNHPWWNEYLLAIVIWPLLISIMTDTSIERLFARGEAVWHFIGNVGYEMYIWHEIVLILCLIVVYYKPQIVNSRMMMDMVLYTLVCFSIGSLAYLFVEKNITTFLRRVIKQT